MVLVVAAHATRLHVERQHGVGVEVVARPSVAHPGAGVSCAPIGESQLGVVVPGHPDGRPAGAPGITGPGVVARLAGSGDRVGSPDLAAGLGVQSDHEAPDAQLTARDPDHDLSLGGERREGHVVSAGVVLDGGAPRDLAGTRLERDDAGVERGGIHLVAPKRDAAVRVVKRDQILGELVLVAPEELAGPRIERVDQVAGSRDEHHPVVDDRWRFVSAGHTGRERPHRNEILDVGHVDLSERAVPPTVRRAPVEEPIRGLGVGEPGARDRRVRGDRSLREHRGLREEEGHRERGGW